jgi:hypothetical protein
MVAVLGTQSIGCQQLCSHAFERTGVEMLEDDITGLFLCKENGDKLWRKLCRPKESVKIDRMRKLHRKVKEGVTKLAANNRTKELLCKAGMMGPDGEEQLQQRQRQKSTAACHHCGAVGHNSSKCLENLETLVFAAEKATGAVGESTFIRCLAHAIQRLPLFLSS